MTRQYSPLATDAVKRLLNVIADQSTLPQQYREVMVQLGQHLGMAMLGDIEDTSKSVYLVATAEDADFLAKGVLEPLANQLDSVGFACFWNDRQSLFNIKTLDVAPILKQYTEPADQVDYLIIVKSIISGGCVVKTNLQNLIQTIHPNQIFVAAPVMYAQAEASLRQAFKPEIANLFRFYYFAKDDERNPEGEVVPGIGGMIYNRLGFQSQAEKNHFTPTLVKQRRQMIMQRRKATKA